MEKRLTPWGNIWIKPRSVMKHILDTNPTKWIIWFALIQGLLSGYLGFQHLWSALPFQPEYTSPVYVSLSLIVSAFVGLLYLYFYGWLLRVTGSWLGGTGDFTSVKCAVGWSFYPYIIASFILIISRYLPNPLNAIAAALFFVGAIWTFVLSLFLIAEAHRFSAWRALGALLLAFILIFVALMLLSLLVPLLRPLFAI